MFRGKTSQFYLKVVFPKSLNFYKEKHCFCYLFLCKKIPLFHSTFLKQVSGIIKYGFYSSLEYEGHSGTSRQCLKILIYLQSPLHL